MKRLRVVEEADIIREKVWDVFWWFLFWARRLFFWWWNLSLFAMMQPAMRCLCCQKCFCAIYCFRCSFVFWWGAYLHNGRISIIQPLRWSSFWLCPALWQKWCLEIKNILIHGEIDSVIYYGISLRYFTKKRIGGPMNKWGYKRNGRALPFSSSGSCSVLVCFVR